MALFERGGCSAVSVFSPCLDNWERCGIAASDDDDDDSSGRNIHVKHTVQCCSGCFGSSPFISAEK